MNKNIFLLSFISLVSINTYGQEKDTINNLQEVEIFGDRNRSQRGLESVTRFPGSPQDQIQSISIISDKLIEEQGALTIIDAVKNIPGVTLFSSYGGNKESMSIRGYRGTPVLRNGVRQDSDFRTAGGLIDMQGVESIQVIKGSAAITQGVGNGLGAAGGLINIVTKTPRFINSNNVGLRVGSWGQVRTTYDLQRVIGENKKFAFRLNGAYQRADSYRDFVNKETFYIQPSIAWRPDDKTEIIAEMDYLDFDATPDRGTVNLGVDSENKLYKIGSKFLGFKTDYEKSKVITYSLRGTRKLTDKIDFRIAYYASYNDEKNQATSIGRGNQATNYALRDRSMNLSHNNDRNSTIQVDLMGKDFNFGIVNWKWQVGYDYTTIRVDTRNTPSRVVDKINVLENINNNVPSSFDWSTFNISNYIPLQENYYYGFMTQHSINFTKYVKVVGGLRWSYSHENSKDVLDPMIGLMISPNKNLNFFGSYTTTSSLRGSTNPLENGGTVGTSRNIQFEFGAKSSWYNDRLRANITYFDIDNNNLSYQIYDSNNSATGLYGLAGNLKRKGIEVDITGRVLSNLQVLLGYAYLDSQYKDSPAYIDGSRPMNAPYTTANAWVQYKFQNTNSFLDNLTLSAGVYYVGSRPVNEYTKRTFIHDTQPGVKPFLMPDYTTLNAQIGYSLKQFEFRMFFNNITNEIGYNSYFRGGYINQNDPFNLAGQIIFKF